MSNVVKRMILVLLASSFITSITIFTFSHRGAGETRVHAAPAVVPLSVYFGSDNDQFYALDAPHGYLRWSYQYQSGGNTWSPAVVVLGKVYFEVSNSASTAVQALSNIDGSVRWSFPFPAGTSGKNGIAVANGIIYFAVNSSTGAGRIYALNTKDGSVAWTYTAATPDQSFGNPIVVNGVVYAAEKSSAGHPPHIYALNATTGASDWSNTIPAAAGTNLASANGVIYFGDRVSSLYAVSAADGSSIWTSQVDGGPASTPTIGGNGDIYYASTTNYVTAVHTSDGSFVWHYLVGKPFTSTVSPILYSGGVYIGSMDLNMYAFQASTGTLIWKQKVGVAITTTAGIKNGIIHVGLIRGALRTLNVSDGLERWFFHTNGTIATSSPPAEG